MDRIAIISDIHSNIVALKAVLKDIEKRQISKIYCLGDLVLKGSSPCEVIDFIREKCDIVIKGNCDAYAVEPLADHAKWYKEVIGEERVKYLDNLPMYKDFYMSGSHIRMFHATKNNYKYKILDNSPLEEKMKLFEDEDNDIPDIVIYADTHKQFLEKIRNKTIINTGSVGNVIEISNSVNMEDDMSEATQANYCILEGELDSKERSSFSIQFVRVPYDIDKELELCRQNNIPDYDLYRLELLKAKYRKQS